jgi:Ty3 transposon capsid-like protein
MAGEDVPATSATPAAPTVENPSVPEPPPAPPRPTDAEQIAKLEAELKSFSHAGNRLQQKVSILQEQLFAAQRHSSKLPSSLKLPSLDKYGGDKKEDLLAWLFQVNEQLSLLQISDEEYRIVYAGTALTGNAKTWYRSMRMEGSVKTWADFQTSLKAHFYPVDPIKHARDQLHPLQQTGSVRDYTATFRQLTAIIGTMAEDEKLDRYVRGLKTRTRREVELKEPDSFDEACRLAEMIDISNDRVFGGSNLTRSTFLPRSQPRRHNGPEPMDINALHNQKEKPKFKKLTPEEKERRRRDGLCLYCGSDKHQLDGCPLRKPQGKGFQRPNRGA